MNNLMRTTLAGIATSVAMPLVNSEALAAAPAEQITHVDSGINKAADGVDLSAAPSTGRGAENSRLMTKAALWHHTAPATAQADLKVTADSSWGRLSPQAGMDFPRTANDAATGPTVLMAGIGEIPEWLLPLGFVAGLIYLIHFSPWKSAFRDRYAIAVDAHSNFRSIESDMSLVELENRQATPAEISNWRSKVSQARADFERLGEIGNIAVCDELLKAIDSFNDDVVLHKAHQQLLRLLQAYKNLFTPDDNMPAYLPEYIAEYLGLCDQLTTTLTPMKNRLQQDWRETLEELPEMRARFMDHADICTIRSLRWYYNNIWRLDLRGYEHRIREAATYLADKPDHYHEHDFSGLRKVLLAAVELLDKPPGHATHG